VVVPLEVLDQMPCPSQPEESPSPTIACHPLKTIVSKRFPVCSKRWEGTSPICSTVPTKGMQIGSRLTRSNDDQVRYKTRSASWREYLSCSY